MTTRIAAVANLALRVFHQHSLRATVAAAQNRARGRLDGGRDACISSPTSDGSQQSECSRPLDTCLPSETLQRLLTYVHALTPTDIGFDVRLISDASLCAAPVVYVHIMENEVFSMGIFVLRPGSRIPLHDHPGMYGILRVVYGAVRCRSFTRVEKTRVAAQPTPLTALSSHSSSKWQLSDLVVARPQQDTVVTADNEPHMLAPIEGNLHEVAPVDGPAVFLDILAPPYDHDLGTRECRFYKEVILPQPSMNQLASTDHDASDDQAFTPEQMYAEGQPVVQAAPSPVVYLVETHQPKDYWCEFATYAGPSVI